MNDSLDLRNGLDAIAKILIRCFFLGILFLFLWFLLILCGGDFVYQWHSKFFEITREHFYWTMYAGITIAKLSIFGVFLFPYIAIRMILAKK
ncbi:MAG: DUF6868 family protein [Candidatus Omnitrophota bacterium]